MTVAVMVTIGLLPIYLMLRSAFWRLPLHVDTGFYVSNHTVATGRIRFSEGWNAHFAGCSKVVPELFYSAVYLLCGRVQRSPRASRRLSYKYAARFWASLFNYLTAIVVGVLGFQLSGGDPRFYYAGLIVFALLSSEPQYGVYFECGELFAMLPNVVSVTMLLVGVQTQDAWWIGAAAMIWSAEVYFVKLSSAIAMAIVFGGAALLLPVSWSAILIGSGVSTLLYIGWIVYNGRNPIGLLLALGRHERSYGQAFQWRSIVTRLKEKARCVARTIGRQPLVPGLAGVGIMLTTQDDILLVLYLLGVSAAFVFQAADVWYYQVPLLPPVALIASSAVVLMASSGQVGIVLLIGAAAIWITHNSFRAAMLDVHRLNVWCWGGHRPDAEIATDVALEDMASECSDMVKGRTLLVYGPYNQAYVLFGASYITPIVAPEFYMDDVSPGWQRTLNTRLVDSPAEFILDTSNSFNATVARGSLGLDYRLTHVFDDRLRLYELGRVSPPTDGYQNALTYEPQCRRALQDEERRAGPGLVVEHRLPHSPEASAESAEQSVAFDELLESLAAAGYRRVGVYGAGRFTIRHRDALDRSRIPIVVFMDDRPERYGGTFLGRPICRPQDAASHDVDAVIISTDRFLDPMLAHARQTWKDGPEVFVVGQSTDIIHRKPDRRRQTNIASSVSS